MSIAYLKLYRLSVKLNCSDFKIYSYCRNVRFRICVVSKSANNLMCNDCKIFEQNYCYKPQEKARLSNA